ncbi:nitroreductase family protein [Candidatus Woesearchaeota archaeon]|nr:nitroreductase family protein [Candidatus Woesearchaeota archaeon]
MNAIEAIKTRRSVREYSDKEISKEDLKEIIDCARMAATARNIQPWQFVVVQDAVKLAKISELAPNGSFIKGANAAVVVFSEDTKYYLEDGSAAICNVMLAAHALSIGSCWIAGDKKPYCEDIKKLFNAPAEMKLVGMVSLGYAKEAVAEKEKKAVDEVLKWESF